MVYIENMNTLDAESQEVESLTVIVPMADGQERRITVTADGVHETIYRDGIGVAESWLGHEDILPYTDPEEYDGPEPTYNSPYTGSIVL